MWSTWMKPENWTPWSEFERLQSEMNRVFEQARRPEAAEFPPINVWSGEEGLRVHAQLAGFDGNDIEVSVVGDTLTLRGSRSGDKLRDGDAYHRQERASGKFVRTLQLPFGIESDDVQAVFKNGVLEVELPRAQAERPRKIPVTTK